MQEIKIGLGLDSLTCLPGRAVPALSAFPYRRNGPFPQSSSWAFTGLSLLFWCLSCTGEHRAGDDTPGVILPVLMREPGSHHLTCWQLCSVSDDFSQNEMQERVLYFEKRHMSLSVTGGRFFVFIFSSDTFLYW